MEFKSRKEVDEDRVSHLLPWVIGHPVLGREGGDHFLCQLSRQLTLDKHLIAPMTGEVADFDVCNKGICRGRKGMTFVQSFKPLF